MASLPQDIAPTGPKRRPPGVLPGAGLVGGGVCLLPMFAVAVAALTGGWEVTGRFAESVLPRYAGTTAILVLVVGIGTAVIGTSTAWLVTATRFPGHRVLEVALALPLAFPAYVLAYAYTDFLDHPGIVQSTLRDLTGWGPRDYWFPEIRSTGGAAAMLTFVLYPYVYLLARAAFLRQSATAYIAARTLGSGPWGAFFKVSVPVARPAIAGGVLLALMETLADYGTVAYFGVQTFATGIYVSYVRPVRPPGGGAACALSADRRADPRHPGTAAKTVPAPPRRRAPVRTDGARSAARTSRPSRCACLSALPVLFGFFLPASILLKPCLRGRAASVQPALPGVPAAFGDAGRHRRRADRGGGHRAWGSTSGSGRPARRRRHAHRRHRLCRAGRA
jgi:iron(III) transport system permease protein